GPGQHSLTVTIPAGFYQVDFVLGQSINHFGPAGSNIFYTPQGRLLSADNGGHEIPPPPPPPATGTGSLSGTVLEVMGKDSSGNDILSPISGVQVTLDGQTTDGQTVHLTTTTGADGSFSFMGLLA